MNEWLSVKIGDLGKVLTGRTPPTKNADYFGEKYPFITPTDMHSGKTIHTTGRYLSEKGANLLKNNYLPPRSICVSCIGWQIDYFLTISITGLEIIFFKMLCSQLKVE
ncbi:MAG: restriction endonuclease subunit S [Xenococcaceae cyanobacterium MO_167.B52]|nr:restriction endonuclease subunit S [Xenococcaceae cyanobacterium MO_167.B52]